MKKVSVLIIIILLISVALSGCLRSYSFFYDYDELRQNLLKAEIIYMEEDVFFFEIHWYVDIRDTDYEIRRELTDDETDRLIRALANMEFEFTILWVPASVSQIFSMQGYGIKLHYEPCSELSYGHNAFMIIAQTGDYRYAMPRLGQARAGREATDEDWNALILEFYYGESPVVLDTVMPSEQMARLSGIIVYVLLAVVIIGMVSFGIYFISSKKKRRIQYKYGGHGVYNYKSKAEEPKTGMYCTNCGHSLESNANFCVNCGTAVGYNYCSPPISYYPNCAHYYQKPKSVGSKGSPFLKTLSILHIVFCALAVLMILLAASLSLSDDESELLSWYGYLIVAIPPGFGLFTGIIGVAKANSLEKTHTLLVFAIINLILLSIFALVFGLGASSFVLAIVILVLPTLLLIAVVRNRRK